jgi:LAO/AO transport system kinase
VSGAADTPVAGSTNGAKTSDAVPATIGRRGGPGRLSIPELVSRAQGGDPRAVARLISLVEDASPDLREVAERLAPQTGRAEIIGVTGSPGVGKSTSTSALVSAYRTQGRRVGVLAVDPSSPFSG